MDAPEAGGLGGTFGGNPVACAAALAVLDEVERHEFRRHAEELGERIRARLDEHRDPRSSRSARCEVSARCSPSSSSRTARAKEPAADLTKRTTEAARERGLILLSCGLHGNVVRILVPLVIADEDLDRGLEILEESLVTQPQADVRLESVTKAYGDVVAVDGVDLDVPAGEFFTMLGPSGSGKTTTLRLIAGFESPDEGRILLKGTDVTRQPPYSRDVNTVFQDYALFPHMTVGENVATGCGSRGVKRAERVQADGRSARARATRRASRPGSRRSSPAASGSGSRSPARSSTARRCSSSTSRSERSTSSSARTCRRS